MKKQFDLNDHSMRWTQDDWSHRDPDDDLHDVETGRATEALDDVSPLTRMLLQDSDCRVHLQEIDGHYRVVKFIKKRDPEYLQGTDNYFVFDKEGHRVTLTEEEYNKLLGLEGNPEDVYNAHELELSSLDSEQSAPKDVWDVIWDETEVLSQAERLVDDEDWQEQTPYEEKLVEFQQLRDGTHPKHPDVREYSADFFPYGKDKRVHSARAKLLQKQILNTHISKAQLAKLMSDAGPVDKRPELAAKLRADANSLPLGKERGKLLNQAQAMMKCYFRSQKAMQRKCASIPLSGSDRRNLWDTWKEHELKTKGVVELTQWQYEKALYTKLVRQGVARKEAEKRVREAVQKLYGSNKIGQLEEYSFRATAQTIAKPEWITGEVTAQVTEEVDDGWKPPGSCEAAKAYDEGWKPCNWLPENVGEDYGEEENP